MSAPRPRLSPIHWTGIGVAAAFGLLLILGNNPSPPPSANPPAAVARNGSSVASASRLEQPTSPSWDELDRISNRLLRQDRAVLSMIPARGYKDGFAGVVRDYRLHVNVNSEMYFNGMAMPEKKRPVGYYFSLFLTRTNKTGRYAELEGVHAVWFREKNETMFKPWNNWAQHFSDHDDWIKIGGTLDYEAAARRQAEGLIP